MLVKIRTIEQVASLRQGDILQQSASYEKHQKLFGAMTSENLVTYEIKSFNRKLKTLSLEVRENKNMFSWPADLRRETVYIDRLISDDTWWINENDGNNKARSPDV